MAAEFPDDASASKLRVFISYSRKDLAFVERVAAAFQVRGFEPYLDKTDIAPGEPWQDRLAALIGAADSIVFVVSPDSTASTICRWEVEESLRLGKRILPMVCRTIDPAAAPPELARLNWTFAREEDGFDAAVAKVGEVLRTNLDWVREHTRLGELAQRWESGGRSNSAVLRGPDLDAAERWLASRPAETAGPTERQKAFIQASRSAATRRQRITVAITAAVAIVSLGLAIWALINRNEAVAQSNAADVARKDAVEQRDQAVAARKEAEAQRDRATRTLAAATDAAQGLTLKLALDFRDFPGIRIEVVRAILDRAEGLLEKLLEFNPPTAASTVARIETLAQIARTEGPGGSDENVKSMDEAYDLAKAFRASQPDAPGIDGAFASAAEIRGQILYFSNDPSGAVRYLREAVEGYRACAARDPKDPLCAYNQVNVQGWVGNALNTSKLFDEAIKAFDDAIELAAAFVTKAPDRKPEMDKMVGGIHKGLGFAYQGKNMLDDALDEYNTARHYMEPRAQGDDALVSDLTALADTLNSMAIVLNLQVRQHPDRSRAAMAIVLLGRARDLTAKVAKDDPENKFQNDRAAAFAQNLKTLCLNYGLEDVAACVKTATSIAPALN